MSVAVFLSGSGTNFEALYKRQSELEELNNCAATIDLVFSNIPECPGAVKAGKLGLNNIALSSKNFYESLGKSADDEKARELYDQRVVRLIEQEINPDLIVLAGYRRKLSGVFYNRFKDKIINLYPGDITKSYLTTGVPASVQAVRNNDTVIKCTVYIDTEGERFGPAIAQSKAILLDKYSEENIDKLDLELREKAEWVTYPFVIFDLISRGRISVDDNKNIYLDGEVLPKNGLQL